jgi:hypothetical protein
VPALHQPALNVQWVLIHLLLLLAILPNAYLVQAAHTQHTPQRILEECVFRVMLARIPPPTARQRLLPVSHVKRTRIPQHPARLSFPIA